MLFVGDGSTICFKNCEKYLLERFSYFPTLLTPRVYSFFLPLIVFFYHIHFEITGDPGNLIGPHRCYSITNSTFFAPNCIFFLANEKAINQSDLKACLK